MKIPKMKKVNINRPKLGSITYSPLLRYKHNVKAVKKKRMSKQQMCSKLNEFDRVLESFDKSTPQTTDLPNFTSKHNHCLSQSNPFKQSKTSRSSRHDSSCLEVDTKSEPDTLPSVIEMPNIRTKCKPQLFEYQFEDSQKGLNLNKSKFNTLDSLMPAGVKDSSCTKKSNLPTDNEIISTDNFMDPVNINGCNSDTETEVQIEPSNGCCIVQSCGNITVAKLFELSSSSCLVVLEPNNPFYFVGVVEIELLKGSVEVLGYCLSKLQNRHWVFSLQGSSHLCFKSTLPEDKAASNKLTVEMLMTVGLPRITATKILKESDNATVLILRKHSSHYSCTVWPFVFQSHIPFPIFPQSGVFEENSRPCHTVEEKLDCLFGSNLQNLNLREFKEVLEWKDLQEVIASCDRLKLVLCGGKGVGKSTLLRYLVNRYLSFHSSAVLVIDFDPGQCEFTVPGCISVVLVEEPLLGPNYSHLKEPLRSVFLGEVDVTKCPQSYIEGTKLLIDFAVDKFSDVPWIINTMGFTRGFGLGLNCGIIEYVQPSHVVQINSHDHKLNFPSELFPEYVQGYFAESFKILTPLSYELKILNSWDESRRKGIHSMSPLESRNLVTMAYLSKMLSAENLFLSKVVPYMISMDRLELRLTGSTNLSKQEVAACLNGNLVALCHLEENNNYPDCRGFGIVRGIDWPHSTLYLITPLSGQALASIDCLVKGNVAVPESVYYQQADSVRCRGHVPYLARTSGRPTARFARREFRTLPPTTAASSRDKRPATVP